MRENLCLFVSRTRKLGRERRLPLLRKCYETPLRRGVAFRVSGWQLGIQGNRASPLSEKGGEYKGS